ncbi:hypothetical protein G7046_g1916 [Stylonectria norvegica]|nr:hypothetical protein G7046_g1916 [Stylonectria norvegica]
MFLNWLFYSKGSPQPSLSSAASHPALNSDGRPRSSSQLPAVPRSPFCPRPRGEAETLAWLENGSTGSLTAILNARDRAEKAAKVSVGQQQTPCGTEEPWSATIEPLTPACMAFMVTPPTSSARDAQAPEDSPSYFNLQTTNSEAQQCASPDSQTVMVSPFGSETPSSPVLSISRESMEFQASSSDITSSTRGTCPPSPDRGRLWRGKRSDASVVRALGMGSGRLYLGDIASLRLDFLQPENLEARHVVNDSHFSPTTDSVRSLTLELPSPARSCYVEICSPTSSYTDATMVDDSDEESSETLAPTDEADEDVSPYAHRSCYRPSESPLTRLTIHPDTGNDGVLQTFPGTQPPLQHRPSPCPYEGELAIENISLSSSTSLASDSSCHGPSSQSPATATNSWAFSLAGADYFTQPNAFENTTPRFGFETPEGQAHITTIRNALSMPSNTSTLAIQDYLSHNISIIRHLELRTVAHPDWSFESGLVHWEVGVSGAALERNKMLYRAIREISWHDDQLEDALWIADDTDERSVWTLREAMRKVRVGTLSLAAYQRICAEDPVFEREERENKERLRLARMMRPGSLLRNSAC